MSDAFIPLSVPNFSGNEKTYTQNAVVSEWVSSGGAMVGEFEQKLAQYVGAKGAVATASGTAGLHLALLVAGVKAGDEVICPTLTFIAAVNPVRYANAHPLFIGCDDSLCLCPNALERFCEAQCEMRGGVLHNKNSGRPVTALMVVHVFGNMANMPRLCDIAKKYSLVLIEDATEALGSRYESGRFAGMYAGCMGDVGVYSFNGNKIITTGSGGMLVSRHDEWLSHAKHLSTQAKSDEIRYTHDEIGYNYRMTNLQAALGLAQLEQLESFIARKNEMYALYHERLCGKKGLRLLPFEKDVRSNRWFYSLFTEGFALSREALMHALSEQRIQTRPIWGLIHLQKPYLGSGAYETDKAQSYQEHVLNLPCSTNLTNADIQRVCDAVLKAAE